MIILAVKLSNFSNYLNYNLFISKSLITVLNTIIIIILY
jgi:hypothetical protein